MLSIGKSMRTDITAPRLPDNPWRKTIVEFYCIIYNYLFQNILNNKYIYFTIIIINFNFFNIKSGENKEF